MVVDVRCQHLGRDLMLSDFVGQAGEYIHASPLLALVAVFIGGILTASNPCVLAMVPLMMSFVAGDSPDGRSVGRAFLPSLTFVSGLAVTFTVLAMVAALAGRMYGEVSSAWNWIVAAVSLLFSLVCSSVWCRHLARRRFWSCFSPV